LTPSGRFLGAACGHHLAHHGWKHVASLLPADEIEALEGLVDEIERVSGVSKGAIRLGGEQEVSERGW
jgi:peptidoglycan/xylan/chitin deacetylase (PgdA/CDA1 family)